MAGKVEKRREDLRKRLIDLAEISIRDNGVGAIKARDLATRAGCALGAIYNVFDDLQDIIIAVNGRTFQRLGAAVAHSLASQQSATPTERLIAMSWAYLEFAEANPNTWRCLFDVQITDGTDLPDWYRQELERLLNFIAGPVDDLYPDMPKDEMALFTRALFSSVHGIVLLGLENRVSGVPGAHLKRMIAMILQQAMQPKTPDQ